MLVTELAHPQHRATFTAIYNSLWYVGAIVAAWLTFGTLHIKSEWAWRVPSLVQAFPSILQLIFVWVVDESPRFLVSRGKSEQALRVLAKCHANGNDQDEVVQLEMQEIHDTLKMEMEFNKSGWLQLVQTKGNRHRMAICITAGFFSQWSGNGIVSYYLNIALNDIGYTDATTQDIINGVLTIFNAFTATGICFFVDRIGRRRLFLISTTGMMFSYMSWTIAAGLYAKSNNTDDNAGRAVLGVIFFYYFFYNLAWSGLLVGYTAEILPYNIRAKGLTIVFLSVDIALFFNQFINPIALKAIGWKYYIVYTCWLAVELFVVYMLYIETRNVSVLRSLFTSTKLIFNRHLLRRWPSTSTARTLSLVVPLLQRRVSTSLARLVLPTLSVLHPSTSTVACITTARTLLSTWTRFRHRLSSLGIRLGARIVVHFRII